MALKRRMKVLDREKTTILKRIKLLKRQLKAITPDKEVKYETITD